MGEDTLNVLYGGKPEPYSIQVEKGQRGTYAWTVKIYGEDPDVIIMEHIRINTKLQATFGGK